MKKAHSEDSLKSNLPSRNNRMPGTVVAACSFDFKFESNTLILILKAEETGPLPNPITYKLVRVE